MEKKNFENHSSIVRAIERLEYIKKIHKNPRQIPLSPIKK